MRGAIQDEGGKAAAVEGRLGATGGGIPTYFRVALVKKLSPDAASKGCALLGMEPPSGRPEAAAAPTAEEAVPDAGRDPETAPLVAPEPEPAAELGEVRVDVLAEQQPGAPEPKLKPQEEAAQLTRDFSSTSGYSPLMPQVSVAPPEPKPEPEAEEPEPEPFFSSLLTMT
eukprot:COSAG04_NODE_4780_length_1897_cov_4.299221_2_plen_170_part_00